MGFKKLIPVVAVPGIALAMAGAAGPAFAAPTSENAPAKAASASGDAHILQTKKSWKCSTPKGQKFNVNYSSGTNSTTFYFNNHCNQKRAFRVYLVDGVGASMGSKCISVNKHTKGKKKVWHIAESVKKVTSPAHC